MKKHFIRLSREEREELSKTANKERVDAQAKLRAKVLLLVDSMVALGFAESLYDNTVWRTLKKTSSNPTSASTG
jgi:hypothetical protein